MCAPRDAELPSRRGSGRLIGNSAPSSDRIETPRLDLILLSREMLEDLCAGRPVTIGGGSPPAEWIRQSDRTLRRRLAQMTQDPSSAVWLVRAMVLRETGAFVGRIGFHGPPGTNGLGDPEALELGYSVEPAFRRQGLAEEAIRGMMGWAAERSIHRFVLSIGVANVPSLQLASKLGCTEVTRLEDEEDGLEIVFALGPKGAS